MCTDRISELIDSGKESYFDMHSLKTFLKCVTEKTNYEIYQRSMQEDNLRGMGTTLSLLMEYNRKVIILNVGDSRIYLIRNNKIIQLSKDDSVVGDLFNKGEISKNELRTHPLRHVLTKAVGTTSSLSFNIQDYDCLKNDYFILCTDGLNEMMEDTEILELILQQKKTNRICQKLIQRANEYGGIDNITVVVYKFMR